MVHPEIISGRYYAIICKIKSHWSASASTHIYIAAGIGGVGTQAAAEVLSDGSPRLAKRLKAENLRLDSDFCGVVDCKRDDFGSPTDIQILKLRKA